MALVLKDRVKQTAAAPGTGTITLGATAAGFQSFASVGNGNTTYFAIVDPISGDWEVNYGVYTSSGTTLTRNATPLSSSTGTLVNFTGAVDVFLTYPSEKAVWQDLSGVVAQQSFGAITATSAALTTGTITGAPVNATDIVNKEYADSIASGLNYHQPVNYASTAALPSYTYSNGVGGVGATITANANGALSLGGGSPTATQRVLIKDEVSGNAPYNGVYVVTQAGSAGTPFILTRASDYDTSGTGTNEIDQGDYVLVISGTLASTAWVQQTPLPITVGTTALTFLQFNAPITYTAGTGLNLSPATTFNISNTGVTASTYGSASAVPVFAVNAQGQITSVTNTNIAISGSAVSGNISGSAGSVANSLTLGTYLTGGTYNGSAAVTATVDATSANTASKVVARDSSGNFSAGTITATLSGSATSATTATNLAGGAANQIAYQSASGTTSFATAPSASNQVLSWNGSAFSWSAGTISGVPLGSNLNSLTAGTYLTGTAYNGSAAQTWAVDATSANTASKVVARDGSGNFSAGTITASLSGNATTATTASDSNLLGGKPAQDSPGINTIPTRDANGYTYLYYISSSTSNNENPTISQFIVTNGGDGFYRKASSASVISQLGLLTTSNYNSYAPTLTGTGASGTWNINVTGSAGSATSITNFTATTSASGFNPDSPPTIDQIGYWTGGHTLYGYADGGLYTSGYNTTWYHQISGDFRSGQIAVRGKNNSTWQSWYYIPTYSLNNGYSTGSLYAGIYYDANDTSYYLDPASTSVLNILGSYYLKNNYSVSTDHPYGVYFDSSLSTSYAIYRTPGAWTHPYPDLRIAFHTGIQIGANPSYGGVRFYTDYDMATEVMSVNNSAVGLGASNVYVNNSLVAGSDLRAPLFYDNNNTAYYVDPASTSNISATYIGGHLYTSYNGYNPLIRASAAGASGLLVQDSTAAFRFQLYGDGSNYGFLGGAWASWDFRKVNGGALFLNNQSTYYYDADVTYVYRVYGTADMRSPIYYDLNDTGYYLDPASTSELNKVYYNSNMVSRNYGIGQVGLYSSYRYQAVFSMGESYLLPTDGTTTGNLYGMAWSHPNAGGAAGNLNSHGLLLLQNGSFMAALSTNGTFSADVRGTIFYDYNNTGYYVDPSSSSYLYSLSLSGSVYFQPNTWIQQNGSYGMYWPNTNGAHLEGNTLSSYGAIAIRGSRNSWGGIYDYYSGVATMYASNGDGGAYREANGRWYFYYSLGNDCMGIGTSSTSSTYSLYLNKGVFAQSRIDATIFYDTNNTGYYLDLNGSSNGATNLYGNWFFTSNRDTSSSDPPLQAYSSGGSGAIMSFHRGGYYAINMGLDSDNVFRIGGWSASANRLQMDMSGNLTMAGNVTAYSDETLKKDWADLPSDFVPRLARVKSGTYTRIDNEMRQIGVGAQSLRPLMEEAVFENADGTLSVAYGNAAMASSVELARYVTALEQRISQLEARI